MEQQEKAKTGGKQRRSTVGDRLGGNGNIGNKNQQTSQQNQQQTQSEQHQDTAQLGQVTQQLKDVNINQQQPAEGELGATNDGTGDGNAGRNRAAKQFEDKEIRFDPPWDFKLGQMQQVVRNLQRHSHILLENRGSVIIRCYPYKSATYMHLVYQLIYEMLSINQQMGQACSPTEIRPILLHYDDNGLPNPEQQPAAPYSSMPQINQQPNWTDIVLVRVRFDQQSPSIAFLQNFNRNVCRAFDRRQVRCPFAHPDLTQPERILRHRLQQICLEKNGGFNRRRRNRFNYNYNNNHSNEPRFFHNGLQIYKEHSNGYIEPVPFDNYTEIQCLHVVVASLRKYATLYREKETSVIMQNIDLEELDEADMERITKLVYLVVNTDEYRQRCQIIQERIKSRQIGLKTSMTNMAEGNQRDPHEFLPEKIERLPRRKRGGPPAQTTTKKESPKKTNGSGGSDGSGEEGRGNDQQKEDEEEKKEERQQNEKKEETAKVVERPPLVRIQFRNKESAAAFCQLFKTCQEQQKKVEMEKNAEGERGHSAADSYSDLSDLEGVFSSEEEYNEEEEGEEGGTEDTEKKNKAKEKKKKQKARRRQPKMCLYFPNSFAHRDLTPPELALGYALRQFCREKNAEIVANNGPSSSNVAGGSGTNDGGQQQRRFFTRLGRIYERIYGTDMDGNVAAAAASPKEG